MEAGLWNRSCQQRGLPEGAGGMAGILVVRLLSDGELGTPAFQSEGLQWRQPGLNTWGAWCA